MTKRAILAHKCIRAYKNEKNWALSKFKGYPATTYFGYTSLKEFINSTLRDFTEFYGKGLKNAKI